MRKYSEKRKEEGTRKSRALSVQKESLILSRRGRKARRSTEQKDVPKVRHTIRTSSHSGFSSKGYLYTLEVFLAISIMIVTLVFLYRSPPQKPNLEISELKVQGMEALEYLDKKGDLRDQAIISNETVLEGRINNTITTSVDFEIDLCKLACDDAGVPRNKTVISVDYYVAGYRTTYNATKIKMWLWRK